MIVVEERLMELFSYLPEITSGSITYPKPVYHFGDGKELNRFIMERKGENKLVYPLIYQTSYEETQLVREGLVQVNLDMFIAYCTETDLFNTQRWATSYRNILMPTFENIHKAFQLSRMVISDYEYNVTKHPNYGNPEQDGTANKTIDIIDALRFRLNCTINNHCINKNIKF